MKTNRLILISMSVHSKKITKIEFFTQFVRKPADTQKIQRITEDDYLIAPCFAVGVNFWATICKTVVR